MGRNQSHQNANTSRTLQNRQRCFDAAASLDSWGSLLPHGAQKALGWFGGYGFTGRMGFLTGTLHIPALFAFLAIAAEFAGSIALILGLGTRIAALGIASTMAVANSMVHAQFGFFMNWAGAKRRGL